MKLGVLASSVICASLLVTVGGTPASAASNDGGKHILKEHKILTSAESLNDSIQMELARITEERITQGTSVLASAESLNNSIKVGIKTVKEVRMLKEEEVRKQEENLEKFLEDANESQFQGYDMRTKTNLSGWQLELALDGTGLSGLGDSFAKAEQEYGVSAFGLIGMACLESTFGKSNFARERHNLFGYQAYDRNTNAAKRFVSKDEAIMTVGNHLSTNYLKPGAMYFNGFTLYGINQKWASDKQWHNKITSIMNDLVLKMQ